MAEGQLPIVFRTSGAKYALAAMLGVAATLVGVLMIVKAATAIAPLVGALLAIAGLVFSVLATISFRRRLPTLELNENGLVYSRALQGVMQISWNEITGIDIQTTTVPREMGQDIELQAVALHLTDWRVVKPPALAYARDMRDAIAAALARAATARG